VSLAPPKKVGPLQDALHAKAKGSPNYRFYALAAVTATTPVNPARSTAFATAPSRAAPRPQPASTSRPDDNEGPCPPETEGVPKPVVIDSFWSQIKPFAGDLEQRLLHAYQLKKATRYVHPTAAGW
jgi:hypothetical protein